MRFDQNRWYSITGPSGAGKTTLLYLLAGLDTPTSGTVLLDGHEDLAQMPCERQVWYRQSVVGMVFQFHYLVYELTVVENIALHARIHGVSAGEARKRALDLCSFVGLHSVADAFPATLSGGERQRVSIARALINKPAFVLADEPTGSLDAANAQSIKELFARIQREFGTGIIVATHDIELFSGDDIQRVEV